MLRTVFWWLVFIPATIFFSILAMVTGLVDRTGKLPHSINRIWGRVTMWASGCSVELIGEENLIQDGGQIILANHQSGFDIYAITAYLPIQLRWIAKKELFKIPFMGWGMKLSGYISIDRENPREAVKSLNKAAGYVKSGYSVVIFPEGTRTLDGKLQEFKKGTLFIARKGRLPITPVTIAGTYGIMRKGSRRVMPQSVKIYIGKPVFYEAAKGRSENEMLAGIRETIGKNLESCAASDASEKNA